MIDHLALTTSPEHHDATVAFYLAFLQPLGYEKKLDMFDGKVVAFGTTGPEFFLSSAELSGSIQADTGGIHLAFRADGASLHYCPMLCSLKMIVDLT